MKRSRGAFRVGTSGYQYDHWKGIFYPEELPRSQWFAFYAKHFDTVEINNTFYRLPDSHVFDNWRAAAPRGLIFALKFSRYGTHRKRLKDPLQPVRLFESRARHLKSTLGPILVQLPPRFPVDLGRLEAFLAVLRRSYRWSMEFRDPRWLCAPVFELLERHGVALCLHDMLPEHPQRITANFTYFRFHGKRYQGNYTRAVLTKRAQEIRRHMADGLDVYAYFNNDIGGYAVRNAVELRHLVLGDKTRSHRPTRGVSDERRI